MNLFEIRRSIAGSMLILFTLSLMISCNEISEGMQRRKFEYLYKMSNYATLYREYTNEITYYSDLDFYDRKGKNLYEDVNKCQTVDGWGRSRSLKEEFLSVMDSNFQTAKRFQEREHQPGDNIRKEYDIIVMNERTDKLIEEIYTEITKVGKE